MKLKLAIIVSTYYTKVSEKLLKGSLKVLNDHGIKNSVKIINVPGTFEIPVTISRNIDSYDGFIALGCIIKGKTPHFNFLSRTVTNGLMNLSISSKKPIGNGIITCLNKKQAYIRSHPTKKNKGKEATIALLSVLKILKKNYVGSWNS